MKQPDLSIIIANYNRKDLLKGCINFIYKHTKGISYEIILIDDCSTDGSVEFIKKNFPKIKLIVNKTNQGPIVANNKGIQKSKGRYVILYDNDVLLTNNTLKQMVTYMDQNPKVGATGCNLIFKDGSFQKSMGSIFKPPHLIVRDFFLNRLFPNNKITNKHLETPEAHKEIKKVSYVKGVCCMMKRTMLKEIGLADEQYHMYAEELDWYYRMLKHNWEIVHLPYGPIIHFEGASGIRNKENKIAEKFQIKAFHNSILFYKKNYGLISSLSYRFLMFISLSTKMTFDFLKHNKEEANLKLKFIKTLFQKIPNNPIEPKLIT